MLNGCSTTGPATASNGKVYWVDTKKCASYRVESDNTTITCFDEDQNITGQLQPMSPEAIALYKQNMMLQAAQIQANLQKAQANLSQLQLQQQQRLQQQQQQLMFMQQQQLTQPRFDQHRSVSCYTIGTTVYCNEY